MIFGQKQTYHQLTGFIEFFPAISPTSCSLFPHLKQKTLPLQSTFKKSVKTRVSNSQRFGRWEVN